MAQGRMLGEMQGDAQIWALEFVGRCKAGSFQTRRKAQGAHGASSDTEGKAHMGRELRWCVTRGKWARGHARRRCGLDLDVRWDGSG